MSMFDGMMSINEHKVIRLRLVERAEALEAERDAAIARAEKAENRLLAALESEAIAMRRAEAAEARCAHLQDMWDRATDEAADFETERDDYKRKLAEVIANEIQAGIWAVDAQAATREVQRKLDALVAAVKAYDTANAPEWDALWAAWRAAQEPAVKEFTSVKDLANHLVEMGVMAERALGVSSKPSEVRDELPPSGEMGYMTRPAENFMAPLQWPRRSRVDLLTPAERAIYDAVHVVEAAGAHPLLTDAVILLGRAREKVADFVDGIRAREVAPNELPQ